MFGLEYGRVDMGPKMTRMVRLYERNARKVRLGVASVVVVVLAIAVNLAMSNLDAIAASSSAITLSEASYAPFQLAPHTVPPVPRSRVRIKQSSVNLKAQVINIGHAREQVVRYLHDNDQLCIHLTHFGVSHDVTVFANATLINPDVQAESDFVRVVREFSIDGSHQRKSRPEWVRVAHYDASLAYVTSELWWDQAACFLHYN